MTSTYHMQLWTHIYVTMNNKYTYRNYFLKYLEKMEKIWQLENNLN